MSDSVISATGGTKPRMRAKALWRAVKSAPNLDWRRIFGDGARGAQRWTKSVFFPKPDPRSSDPELDFMNPSALIGRGRIIIAVFAAIFFGWGGFVPLDSALMAPGTIVVQSHRKSIQHLEGGIAREILVRDGQSVTAGQALLRLDDTQAKANLSLLEGQADALAAQEARLLAERDGLQTIAFPADLLNRQSNPAVAAAMRGEQNAFQARRETLAKQLDILAQRNEENAKIIAGLKNQQAAAEKQIGLFQKEIASLQTLYDKRLVTQSQLLSIQRQSAGAVGQRGQLADQVAQIQLSSGENDMQMMNLRNQNASEIAKDLRDVQTQHFNVMDRVLAARDVLSRLIVTAPVSGKVVSLTAHTQGAVIKPGETIMEIVPGNDALAIEAHVRPQDADKIHPGMSARVTLSSYETRRLPAIDGTVSDVSADQLVDQRTGQAYFSVRIKVEREPLKDYPQVRLIPGLPVEVAVLTGSRTALSYLVEPITDVLRRGMREK